MNDFVEVDRCEICGVIDELNWDKLGRCCNTHDRLICDVCYKRETGQIEHWTEYWTEPCPVNWDRVDSPPLLECIVGLHVLIQDLAA